jgi:hypothetical protein
MLPLNTPVRDFRPHTASGVGRPALGKNADAGVRRSGYLEGLAYGFTANLIDLLPRVRATTVQRFLDGIQQQCRAGEGPWEVMVKESGTASAC